MEEIEVRISDSEERLISQLAEMDVVEDTTPILVETLEQELMYVEAKDIADKYVGVFYSDAAPYGVDLNKTIEGAYEGVTFEELKL